MVKIIHTVGSLAPETGGPARSVPNLALALADQGIDVTILSIDLGPQFSTPLIPSHPLLKTIIVPAGITAGMRTIWVPEFRKALRSLCRDQRNLLLHDHGVWLPQNGIAAQMANQFDLPLVISPRGMVEPWAMQFHRTRKIIAWQLFQKHRFGLADLFHATSASEAESIRTLGVDKPICIIPNGTLLPSGLSRPRREKKGEKKRILFLSRIHPKKGLLNLVEAMRCLDFQGWELVIAGYDESGHQKIIETAVREAGLSDSVEFCGPVANEDKWEFYREFDLFVLPSFSENFGIVVAEALACGLPVITTTGTPWEDLARYNCGWWVDPTVEDLSGALREALQIPDMQRIEMGIRGRELVERKYSWQAIAKQMVRVYRYLLEDGDPPDTIFFN